MRFASMNQADRFELGRVVRFRVALVPVVVFVGLCFGCEPREASTPDRPRADVAARPSIVCLTPCLTQMLIEMGKQDQIVGVSIEDKRLHHAPRCGSFNRPDMERLAVLRPDLVLTEAPLGDREAVPQKLVSRSDQGVYRLGVYAHVESILDIKRVLTDPESGLGQVVDDPLAAEKAWRRMAGRMALIEDAADDLSSPRVLMLIEPATLGSLGVGVVHAELLKRVGAVNAARAYRTGYLQLTREQLQREVRPDVILILEPNGLPLQANDPRLRALQGLEIPAVQNKRIVLIDHPDAMLTSTSLPGVFAQIAKAIYPQRSDAIDRAVWLGTQADEPQDDDRHATPASGARP